MNKRELLAVLKEISEGRCQCSLCRECQAITEREQYRLYRIPTPDFSEISYRRLPAYNPNEYVPVTPGPSLFSTLVVGTELFIDDCIAGVGHLMRWLKSPILALLSILGTILLGALFIAMAAMMVGTIILVFTVGDPKASIGTAWTCRILMSLVVAMYSYMVGRHVLKDS
jgi:hypothetical protein